MNFNSEMFAKLREATSILQSEGPMAATAAIQRALGGMGGMPGMSDAWSAPKQDANVMHDINPRTTDTQPPKQAPDILQRFRSAMRGKGFGNMAGMGDIIDVDILEGLNIGTPVDTTPDTLPGQFIAGSFANHAGRRAYKLYVPSSYRGQEGPSLPLIVLLHGCKQNPDDFARGTQMNALAEERNCLVLYPAQSQHANGSSCWNWFKSEEQQRDRGEPSLIADMTREILRSHQVDPERVYIAGLSAGGAMAAVMANAYPDLYAAVGMHSGLPHGAAHDMISAFAAMRQGMTSGENLNRAPIPAIVFHGDRDKTVHPRNSEQALAQCMAQSAPKASRADESGKRRASVDKGQVPGGRAYTKVLRYDDEGRVIAEHWTVHGAGHAWSGGSRKGSYTDPKGPDASREMLRFFLQHRNAVSVKA